MSVMQYTAAPSHGPQLAAWPRGLELAAFCFCVGQAAFLAASFAFGHWLYDPSGARLANDFIGFWPAGQLILDGKADLIYNEAAHKAAGSAVIGYDFEGTYPLFYPPPAMLLFALLATMPYMTSYIVWVTLNPLPYIYVFTRIVGDPRAILLACAFPALLANVIIGQNGCVTAALFGGALLAMPKRPILAGVLIGLLTYKPHFGILIPIALLASQQWRVTVAATVTALAMAALSLGILGAGAWEGFLNAILSANQNTLTGGRHDWSKLQSLFGLVRVLGGSVDLAWVVHGTAMAVMAVWVFIAWSGRQPFAIKAAVLSVGAVIAAPYVYMYDVMLLAIPVAFLLRDARERGFLPGELLGIGVACLLLGTFPIFKLPVGVGSELIVASLIARRWFALADREALPAAAVRA